jgi:hypothetical protein
MITNRIIKSMTGALGIRLFFCSGNRGAPGCLFLTRVACPVRHGWLQPDGEKGHTRRRGSCRVHDLPADGDEELTSHPRCAGVGSHRQRGWRWGLHSQLECVRRSKQLQPGRGRQRWLLQPHHRLLRIQHIKGYQRPRWRDELLSRPSLQCPGQQWLEQRRIGRGDRAAARMFVNRRMAPHYQQGRSISFEVDNAPQCQIAADSIG